MVDGWPDNIAKNKTRALPLDFQLFETEYIINRGSVCFNLEIFQQIQSTNEETLLSLGGKINRKLIALWDV